MGDLEGAESRFRKVVSTHPNHAEARSNLGHLLLSRLEFEPGWVEHEWRLRSRGFTTPLLQSPKPLWDGSPTLARVLLWAEQGLGEQILHSTMLRDAAALAPCAIVSVDPRLVAPLRRSHPSLTVVDHTATPDPESHDLQLPLGSLGRITRPDVHSFGKIPRQLVAPAPELADSHELSVKGATGHSLKVGISWCSPMSRYRAAKDVPLADMMQALGMPGIALVNLQYGPVEAVEAEVAAAEHATGISLHTVPGLDMTRDIEGVLVVLARCDLIVTACNTLAHLAGACGVPSLVLAPAARGIVWCWHDIEGTSPWYPSTRIFRQSSSRSWLEALSACRTHLLASVRNADEDARGETICP
jgi:hypothetical protein